jgi:two-component sensor histidine kinase
MPRPSIDGIFDSTGNAASDAAAEANHRIANTLAIIAGLIRSELLRLAPDARTDLERMRRLLQQTSVRIDALGRLHRLLMDSQRRDTVDISAYLREIADAATFSLTDRDQRILCCFEDKITVPAKQATAIGLLVTEALVNSIKHAHPPNDPTTIWLTCRRPELDVLQVEIIDDGIGAVLDFTSADTPLAGNGVRLMRNIARDLGGTLEFGGGAEGQIVRLEMPLRISATRMDAVPEQCA